MLAMIKICQSESNHPLEMVMDLEEAGKDPYDLRNFILEHYPPAKWIRDIQQENNLLKKHVSKLSQP